jgi:hypothetical protein
LIRGRWGQSRYFVEQAAAMADGSDAELAQIVGGQSAQHDLVDVIVGESCGESLEAQAAQPLSNVHRRACLTQMRPR